MRILTFILLLTSCVIGKCQTDTVAHIYTFGGINNDVAEELQATSDGGYIVIGSTSSNSWGNTDAYLLKVDSNCNYVWSKALGGPNNDWGYSIKETHDKGFIIATSSNSTGNGGYDASLIKRDSSGNFLWQKTYGGNDWDFAYSVVQTYDSGYAFCGETYNNSNGFSDVYVVRTNSIGDTLWTQTIGGPMHEKGNSIIETADSSLVIAGVKNTVTDSTQLYVLKFSASGNLLWDSIYGDTLHEYANEIIELNTGDFVIAGNTTSNSVGGDQNYLIKAINGNGTFLWDFTIVNGPVPTPKDEDAMAIYQLPDTRLLITGYSMTGGSTRNIIFFHLNTAGAWAGQSNVMGNNNDDDYLHSIALGINGEIVCAGVTRSMGAGQDDVVLVRMDTIYNGQDTSVTLYNDTTPLFVHDMQQQQGVSVYPNPVKEYLNIRLPKQSQLNEITIYDLNGKLVLNGITEKVVRLVNLPSGIYQIEIRYDRTKIGYTKIFKH